MKRKLQVIYEKQYKKLLIIPFLLLLLAFVQIGVQTAVTGDFVHKGISLKGGSTVTIVETAGINIVDLQAHLGSKFPSAELSVRTLSSAGSTVGIAIDSDAQSQEELDVLTQEITSATGLSKVI